MRRTVKWHEDERVDVPDLSQVQGDVKQFLALLLAFMAGPSAAQTGLGDNPNAVWQAPIDLEFDGADVVIKIGTRLVLASNVDGATIVEWEAEEVLAGYTPTVGSPDRILMAQIAGTTTDVDSEDRVFRDSGTGSEQVINVATGEKSDVAWTWCDNVEVDIHAQESLGYSKVARLKYNGGAPPTFTWFYILPNLDDAGRRVQSLTEAVEALRGVIGRIQGPMQDWDRVPTYSLDSLAAFATVHNGHILNLLARVGALETAVAKLEAFTMGVPLMLWPVQSATDAWVPKYSVPEGCHLAASSADTGTALVPFPNVSAAAAQNTLVSVTLYGLDYPVAPGFVPLAGTVSARVVRYNRSGRTVISLADVTWSDELGGGESIGERVISLDPAKSYGHHDQMFIELENAITAGNFRLLEAWADFDLIP
jgi:hypothetical protein